MSIDYVKAAYPTKGQGTDAHCYALSRTGGVGSRGQSQGSDWHIGVTESVYIYTHISKYTAQLIKSHIKGYMKTKHMEN